MGVGNDQSTGQNGVAQIYFVRKIVKSRWTLMDHQFFSN